jgi:hypothetical protein
MNFLFSITIYAAAGTPDEAYVSERNTLVRDATESQLSAWEAGPDWKKRVTALDVQAWQYDRSVAVMAWTSVPVPTRAGSLRLVDPSLETPSAAGPLLARLTWGNEDTPVRAALVDALPRTQGAWPAVLAFMLPDERDPVVRAATMETARFAPPAEAAAILVQGFGDSVGEVRAAAVRTTPYVAVHKPLEPGIVGLFADADAVVRAEAARAAGWLQIAESWEPLVKLLADTDARVRASAVRSLQRLDAAEAAELPQIESLKQDKDLKVQRAANQVE